MEGIIFIYMALQLAAAGLTRGLAHRSTYVYVESKAVMQGKSLERCFIISTHVSLDNTTKYRGPYSNISNLQRSQRRFGPLA